MAQTLTLRDNATAGSLTSADISGDHIFVGADQTNLFQQDLYLAANIIIEYANMDFTGTGGPPQLQAVVEGKADNGTYYPVAYQFNFFQTGEFDVTHEVTLDPDVLWTDAGVANGFFTTGAIGPRISAEVSYNPIALPQTWRVCIRAFEPSGSTLTTVDVDMKAELTRKEV